MIQLILSGIAAGFLTAVPIGPVNLAVIRRAATHGFPGTWALGLGAATADAFYVLLVLVGCAPFLEQSRELRLILWTAGGLVLVLLGAMGLRRRPPCAEGEPRQLRAGMSPWLAGFLITLLNPMTVVSWLLIGGTLVSTLGGCEGMLNILLLTGTIFAGSASWFCILAFAMHHGRRLASETFLRRVTWTASFALLVCGVAFLGMAVWTGLHP